MKNKITNDIAFDIDGVMVNLMEPVCRLIRDRGHTIDKIASFDMTKYIKPQISKKLLYEIFQTVYQKYNLIPIYDKAAELCTRLHIRTNDPILFITSRGSQYATETHLLVKRFCRVPYTIAFANEFKKLVYLNSVTYFVEDRRKTALSLAENDKAVFVPKRTWNENINNDGIVYIESIKDLLNHINLITK